MAKGKKRTNAAQKRNSTSEDGACRLYKKPAKEANGSAAIREISELDSLVLWRRPHLVIPYAVAELTCLGYELILSVLRKWLLLFFASILLGCVAVAYSTPGPHQPYFSVLEKKVTWWLWWVFLGVLSSIGLGSGLHTFLLYLGPHIAQVTLAGYECGSLDFPEPPYPESIVCPATNTGAAVSLLSIVAKVRWESLLWGAGTAIGELPPYFMARAARLSGKEDDDIKEVRELEEARQRGEAPSNPIQRVKMTVEAAVARVGFLGIMACASIPNPFFDLAGITCGHFLVPFSTFFGATVIGKAIIKMHLQMLFVIIAFSEHHVQDAVSLLSTLPYGDKLKQPISDFLLQQKESLHRNPGNQVVQKTTLLQSVLGLVVTACLAYFVVSLLHSLASSFHKRRCEEKVLKRN